MWDGKEFKIKVVILSWDLPTVEEYVVREYSCSLIGHSEMKIPRIMQTAAGLHKHWGVNQIQLGNWGDGGRGGG